MVATKVVGPWVKAQAQNHNYKGFGHAGFGTYILPRGVQTSVGANQKHNLGRFGGQYMTQREVLHMQSHLQ